MSRDPNFCWIHMESYCVTCEADQLKKIVKDAIKYIKTSVDFADELDGDHLLRILERPIKSSTIEFKENGDGVKY